MAGIWPDVPNNRIAWHRDGTILTSFREANGITTELSAGNRQTLNDESNSAYHLSTGNGGYGNIHYGLWFPELRTLTHLYTNWALWCTATCGNYPVFAQMDYSANATNPGDGTWTSLSYTGYTTGSVATDPTYRSNIRPWAPPVPVKAIRCIFTAGGSNFGTGEIDFAAWHIFGRPTVGQTRYLIFTDLAGAEVTGPYFDFGDDSRGGATEDKTFKIKNGHASLTANSIVVSCSTLTDKSPSFADDYTFSTNGTTFTSTINIGALGPGSSSGTLYVRRTTPGSAAFGLEAPLFSAVAGTWT